MIGRDIEQNSDVGTEVIHIVQLEATQFNDVVFMRIFSHLERQTLAYVACQANVVAC